MLLDAKLPKKYCAESVSTAAYLRDRSPTKAAKDKRLYETWYGEKPKVDHLRVFGCDAYERGKLDSKARKCVLLGYSETKGYRLYHPSKDKVIFSRDVRFNETEKSEVSFESSAPIDEDTDRMIIEFSDESESQEAENNSPTPSEPVQARRSTRERRPCT